MSEQNGKGYLRIWTTTAGSALPVTGVAIRIEDEAGNLLHVLRTGESGLTPTVTLPAPPASDSLKPDTAGKPYAAYYLTIDMPEYQPIRSLAVPIFDGITSLQPVTLLPLTAGGAASNDSPYLLYPRVPYERPDEDDEPYDTPTRDPDDGVEDAPDNDYLDDNDLPDYGRQSDAERRGQ